jgi:predicted dinucleotide-binding enzyme
MLVAGDDEAAKPRILALVSAIGFEAVDAGPLSAARLLEPMALMWIRLALFLGQGRDFAFALLRR